MRAVAARFELDRGDWLACGCLLAGALAIRLAAIAIAGFDGLHGQDAFAYHRYAGELREALAAGQPPPTFFWPLGYPLLVVAATTVFGTGPSAGQAVSVLAGSLLAPLLYVVARESGAKAAGAALAGSLAASAAQPVIWSLSVMSDAAGVAWVTLSAWALLRYSRTLRLRALGLAAFSLACAILTRWVYLTAIMPWGLAVLLCWRAGAVGWKHAVRAALLAAAIGLVVVGMQFLPAIGSAVRELPHTGDLATVGWNPGNAVRATVANSDGTFHYRWPIGMFYAMQAVHPRFIFPVLAPFLLLGLWELRKSPASHVALLAGWPAVVLALLSGIAWENPRFSLAMFPPLAILAGIGFDRALQSRLRQLVVAAAAVGLSGSLAWTTLDVHRFVRVKRADLAVVRWADEQAPPGAKIVALGLTEMLRHYTGRDVMELYSLDARSVRSQSQSSVPIYLLVDPGDLAGQWRGMAPDVNFESFRRHGSLVEAGRHSTWALFRLETHSP